MGRAARHGREADAGNHVAGPTVGRDLPERVLPMGRPAPRSGPGDACPGFAPAGPRLVNPTTSTTPVIPTTPTISNRPARSTASVSAVRRIGELCQEFARPRPSDRNQEITPCPERSPGPVPPSWPQPWPPSSRPP
nr:fumarylacetoacetate hydrolase family protein [Streptomyces sp. VRA16 Mangrove soil]